MVTVMPICFVDVDIAEIRIKCGLLQKFGGWLSLRNVGSTHKQDPHLQGTNKKAEIYTKSFTQDARSRY